jgi:hypothetical protein
VTSCPGRDAAFFTLLLRTGTAPDAGVRYGPAHHAVKNGALALRPEHESYERGIASIFIMRTNPPQFGCNRRAGSRLHHD